jgi:hypothetical protein
VGQRAVQYALAGYCRDELIATWTCEFCQQQPQFDLYSVQELDSDNVLDDEYQYFVGYDPSKDQIVLSFRGSFNIENWLNNLEFWYTSYPGVSSGYVHSGFYEGWNFMYDYVMADVAVMKAQNPTADILVTGHSLGGAFACLAALDIKNTLGMTVSVITFGEPRWCNQNVVKYFESKINYWWRVVNENDIVPTIPPSWIGYYHTGHQVWYKTMSNIYSWVYCSTGESSSCYYFWVSVLDHIFYMTYSILCSNDENVVPSPYLLQEGNYTIDELFLIPAFNNTWAPMVNATYEFSTTGSGLESESNQLKVNTFICVIGFVLAVVYFG